MKDPKLYEAIAMYGRYLGSYAYYIEQEQERAARDNAPLDAISEKTGPAGAHTGDWTTVRDLSPNHEFRISYERRKK